MADTVWTDELILDLVKEDLGRRNPTESTVRFLQTLIQSAKIEISAEGIELPKEITSANDARLVASYACWLYRKRAATGEDSQMPRTLRYALNNRAFGVRED